MSVARAAATVAALSDDPRLVRSARAVLEAELRSLPMRDAATNPYPTDFCAPVLIDPDGDTDPHGPNVVSPEIGSAEYERQLAERADQ